MLNNFGNYLLYLKVINYIKVIILVLLVLGCICVFYSVFRKKKEKEYELWCIRFFKRKEYILGKIDLICN